MLNKQIIQQMLKNTNIILTCNFFKFLDYKYKPNI